MELSIIIVNWNSAEYLLKCLETIYDNTAGLDYEIIVVDNASYDGSEALLREKYPEVSYVQSSANLGFARANNLGYSHSLGSTLLFLNPDTEIIGPALKTLYDSLHSTPGAGAIGCRLLNSDMTLQTSCVQPFPTPFNQLLDADWLKLRFPGLRFWGIRPLYYYNGTPEKVSVISGACLMIKREVFDEIGQFSVNYFMYSEDVDLCYKVHEAAYSVYYADDATVIHHGGGSTRKKDSFFNVVVKRESIFKFLEKTRGRFYAATYKAAMMAGSAGRLLLITVAYPWAMLNGRTEETSYSFSKWKKILRWSVGLEKWASALSVNKG